MNINFIQDYTNEYFFEGKKEEGVKAFRLDLDDSIDKAEQITQFFGALKIHIEHLYLLTYASYGLFYNKLAEWKKVWGLYPDMKFPMVGDTHTYTFPSGIVFASYVRLDQESLKNGIKLLVEHHLQSAMIYSPNVLLNNENIAGFFKNMFEPKLQSKKLDPSLIFMNFNDLISYFSGDGIGIIRYGTDGCFSEVSCFTRNNLLAQ